MANVASNYVTRLVFTAWLEDYKVTRRARRWFHEQGGAQGDDSEEEREWYWPEGDDPISSLPRSIAVKVQLIIPYKQFAQYNPMKRKHWRIDFGSTSDIGRFIYWRFDQMS